MVPGGFSSPSATTATPDIGSQTNRLARRHLQEAELVIAHGLVGSVDLKRVSAMITALEQCAVYTAEFLQYASASSHIFACVHRGVDGCAVHTVYCVTVFAHGGHFPLSCIGNTASTKRQRR